LRKRRGHAGAIAAIIVFGCAKPHGDRSQGVVQKDREIPPRPPRSDPTSAADAALREDLPPNDRLFPSALAIGGSFRLVPALWSAWLRGGAGVVG
jgi:hypothetical protein